MWDVKYAHIRMRVCWYTVWFWLLHSILLARSLRLLFLAFLCSDHHLCSVMYVPSCTSMFAWLFCIHLLGVFLSFFLSPSLNTHQDASLRMKIRKKREVESWKRKFQWNEIKKKKKKMKKQQQQHVQCAFAHTRYHSFETCRCAPPYVFTSA